MKRKATPPPALYASRWGTLRGRRTRACTESSCARTGRSHYRPPTPIGVRAARGRLTPYARDVRSEKSDCLVVPAKPPNKALWAAEVVEERGQREGNTASNTRPGRSAGSRRDTGAGIVYISDGLDPDLVSDPSEEPSAVVPHAGICAGGRPKGRSLPRPKEPKIASIMNRSS